MTPNISISVNILNPGQVFACMGLCELASCLTGRQGELLAWFEECTVPQTRFHLAALKENGEEVSLEAIMLPLKTCTVEEMEFNEREGPVRLGPPFGLMIDWRDSYPRNKTAKTWAGQQRMGAMVKDLLGHLPEVPDGEILSASAATDGSVTFFNATQSMGAQDVGFSHNELKLYELSVFPACELLCLIGLQRACPSETGRYSRRYAVWSAPLPLNAAALVVSATVPMRESAVFGFDMFKRSPDGKYKSFASARPLANEPEGEHDHE